MKGQTYEKHNCFQFKTFCINPIQLKMQNILTMMKYLQQENFLLKTKYDELNKIAGEILNAVKQAEINLLGKIDEKRQIK